jgi:hypothetical protein
LNITPWLFQILNQVFITLEKAKDRLLAVQFLCDYHYRVRQLDEELLRSILDFAGLLLEDKQSINIAEATGFGDKYNLNWERGTELFRLMLGLK